MSRTYDKDPQTLVLHEGDNGISVPGTAASATELLRVPINRKIRFETTARLTLKTGGTAAGPTIYIGKSAAGTGTVSQIGTHNVGTSADNLTSTVTLTTTDDSVSFDAGDVLVITNAAGTAASTPVVYAITLDYKPDFD